jgi:hypothetical protein
LLAHRYRYSPIDAGDPGERLPQKEIGGPACQRKSAKRGTPPSDPIVEIDKGGLLFYFVLFDFSYSLRLHDRKSLATRSRFWLSAT